MRGQVAQWKGDNVPEIQGLLNNHHVRVDKEGEYLHVQGIGLDTTLRLGDSMIVDGDRMGIMRASTDKPLTEDSVTWTGDNLPDVAAFVKAYGLTLGVSGWLRKLNLFAGPQCVLSLNKGDKLIKRDGQIIVSVAGKNHRN